MLALEGRVMTMDHSFEERIRRAAEIIRSSDPGITEMDIEQMLEDEIMKPPDQMNLPWIDLLLDALDPLPLSECEKKYFIENVLKMLELNDK